MTRCHECDPTIIEQFFESESQELAPVLLTRLETCLQCRAYFEELAADATYWDEAQTMLQQGEFDLASHADFCNSSLATPHLSKDAIVQSVVDLLDPTDDPHQLGRVGGYEISGVIGVGGMGIVLKAFDHSLDRVVAIKLMAPQFANNKKARQRFSREARAAAAVLHPNVIPIHSVDESGRLPFLVMAYIRGESLQGRLDRQGALNLEETLRIGTQIAAGLAAAHEQGLIHRDIKPENILLEGGVERVTITDFGLARAVDDHTITQLGAIAGTPQYMSPEQALGQPLDQQSDLFSLGSVLYTICTGRPPYDAESSFGVMRKIIDEDPVSILSRSPQTPAWLAGLIEKLMSKDKSNRFRSAAEVRSLLERCLGHVQKPHANVLPNELSEIVNRANQSTSGIPRVRRTIIVLACLALVVGAVGLLQFRGDSKDAAKVSSPASTTTETNSKSQGDGVKSVDATNSEQDSTPGLTYEFSDVPERTFQLLGFRPEEIVRYESTKPFATYYKSLIFEAVCDEQVDQVLTADYLFDEEQFRVHLVKVRGCTPIDFLVDNLGVEKSEVDQVTNLCATNRDGFHALILGQTSFALATQESLLAFLDTKEAGSGTPKIVQQSSDVQESACFGLIDLTVNLAQQKIWQELKKTPNVDSLSSGLTPFLDCSRFSFALVSDEATTSIRMYIEAVGPKQQARIEKSVHLFFTYVGNLLESGNAIVPSGLRFDDVIEAFDTADVSKVGDRNTEVSVSFPSDTKELWVVGTFFPEFYRLQFEKGNSSGE